jgi:hypothetical protein
MGGFEGLFLVLVVLLLYCSIVVLYCLRCHNPQVTIHK